MKKRTSIFSALLLTLTLAACSDARDGSRENQPEERPEAQAGYFGDVTEEPRDGTPRETFTMGAFQEPRSLDPTIALGTGTSGGNEIAALYDTLIAYNPITLEYEPRLAESFSFNDDGTELTLTLRPDLTFTDGTPVNAEAVIFSLQRHVGASRYGSTIALVEMEAVDELTTVLTFDEPFYAFIGNLAGTPGALVSPTAVEADPEGFGNNPVGAGPYMVERWEPGEELVLTANPDYWGGEPPTDQLRFVYLGAGETTFDSLQSGSIDAMFTREPAIAQDLYAEYRGYTDPVATTQVIFMHMREPAATVDPRLRRAVVHAIDPQVVSDRAYEGGGIPTKSLLPEGASLHGAATTLTYDPAAATALVEEAKTDGYNGDLELLCDQTVQERNVCQVLEGHLGAVGFNVSTEYTRDKVERIWTQKTFEISVSSNAISDTEIASVLSNNYRSDSPTNVVGYANPNYDAAITQMRGAEGPEELRAALAQVQAAIDEDPPIAFLAATPGVTAWESNVTGITPAGASTVYFDKVVVTD